MTTRIAIIGGFLGTGKTTLVNLLSERLTASGKTVALVTNDQGDALVDTQYGKGNGYEVIEVLRGCFCCRFPDLLNGMRELVTKVKPDIIITEPVGSCTDLQATVVAPLRVVHPNEFKVAPLMVLVDSSALSEDEIEGKTLGGYLRKHQISEAEHIVLSKVDLISSDKVQEVIEAVAQLNPKAKVIPYSAITGEGLDRIVSIVDSELKSGGGPVDVDYDIYARAEAELGWYNGRLSFKGDRVDSYDLGTRVLRGLAESYGQQDIAHAKVMVKADGSAMKMSMIYGNLTVDWVKRSRYTSGDVEVLINARIVSTPEDLRASVRKAVEKAMGDMELKDYALNDECFSPGRPDPTYRMTAGA